MFKHINRFSRSAISFFSSIPKTYKIQGCNNLAKQLGTFQSPIIKQRFSSATDLASNDSQEMLKDAYASLNSLHFKEAQEKFQKINEAFSKPDQSDPEVQFEALIGLATTLASQEKTEEAINYLDKAQNILASLKIEDKVFLSHLNDLLGRNYRQVGKLDEALKYTEEAVNLRKEGLSREDNTSGLMLYDIAVILRQKKELIKAKSYFLRSMEAFKKDRAVDERQLFFLYHDLARLLSDLKEFSEALVYWEKVTNTLENEQDFTNIFKAEASFQLARAYGEAKDFEKAAQSFLKIYELSKENIEEKVPMTVLLEGVGQQLMKMKKLKEAAKPFSRCIKLYKELGPQYNARIKVINEYLTQIYVGESEKSLRNALESLKKNLGEGHPLCKEVEDVLDLIPPKNS